MLKGGVSADIVLPDGKKMEANNPTHPNLCLKEKIQLVGGTQEYHSMPYHTRYVD